MTLFAFRDSIMQVPCWTWTSCCRDIKIPPRMNFPDLIPVLVVRKRGPNMLTIAAHEENGLQDVSQCLHHTDISDSLPFPSRQCAVATGSKQRRSIYTSHMVLWRAGAVQIDLSANAAEQMSQYLDDHVMCPPLASLKTRRWTRPSPSARL